MPGGKGAAPSGAIVRSAGETVAGTTGALSVPEVGTVLSVGTRRERCWERIFSVELAFSVPTKEALRPL